MFPFENLERLHEAFPKSCLYLSMLSFQLKWENRLPRLPGTGSLQADG